MIKKKEKWELSSFRQADALRTFIKPLYRRETGGLPVRKLGNKKPNHFR
jgi:hypothetical protein